MAGSDAFTVWTGLAKYPETGSIKTIDLVETTCTFPAYPAGAGTGSQS